MTFMYSRKGAVRRRLDVPDLFAAMAHVESEHAFTPSAATRWEWMADGYWLYAMLDKENRLVECATLRPMT